MSIKIEDSSKGVWIYSRVANKQGENELEKQKVELITFAKEKGYEIIGSSQDIGSGLDYGRKGLKEIIEAAESGNVDMVLVKSLSTIGRDLFKIHEVLNLLSPNVSAIISPIEGVMQISTMLQSFKAQMEIMIDHANFDNGVIDEPDELEDDEDSQEI